MARQIQIQYLEESRSTGGGAVETQRAAALANDPLAGCGQGTGLIRASRRWRGLFVVIREIRAPGRGGNFINQRPG